MMRRRLLRLGAGALALAACAPARALARDPSGIDLLRAVVAAGGGPSDFKAVTFVESLTGASPGIELAQLTRRFGAARVKTFVRTFDYVIADSVRSLAHQGVTFTAGASTESQRGAVLAKSLYAAGLQRRTGSFDVEAMLDRLLSPDLHMRAMMRVASRYGEAADVTYHLVLARLVVDSYERKTDHAEGVIRLNSMVHVASVN